MISDNLIYDVPNKCQIFTPVKYAKKLLDIVGYKRNLYGKKIIENSCGNGQILVEIVDRYIIDGKKNGLSHDIIQIGLQNDIIGFELDPVHVKSCKSELDKIAKKYNFFDIQWKIYQEDFLTFQMNDMSFDFIVGNPPYISYRDLNKETREFVRHNFMSCSVGKFDYCYPFIEKSLNILKQNGHFSYLIPTSIFKNVFACSLREIIKPHSVSIYDFKTIRIFSKALITSAIIYCEKGNNYPKLKYIDSVEDRKISIDKEILNNKWIFKSAYKFKNRKKRLGDYFNVSLSIATLRNRIYILTEYEENKNFLVVGKFKIEKKITRPAYSPRSKAYKKTEYIIFPYKYTEKGLSHYSENEIKKYFPYAYEYLRHFKNELDARNSDASAKWFEYGRSQALLHMNQEKLMMSTIITNKVNLYYLAHNEISYSGFYITSKGIYDLSIATSILESNDFLNYAYSHGIYTSGQSIRITADDIKNYQFDY